MIVVSTWTRKTTPPHICTYPQSSAVKGVLDEVFCEDIFRKLETRYFSVALMHK